MFLNEYIKNKSPHHHFDDKRVLWLVSKPLRNRDTQRKARPDLSVILCLLKEDWDSGSKPEWHAEPMSLLMASLEAMPSIFTSSKRFPKGEDRNEAILHASVAYFERL